MPLQPARPSPPVSSRRILQTEGRATFFFFFFADAMMLPWGTAHVAHIKNCCLGVCSHQEVRIDVWLDVAGRLKHFDWSQR